MIPSSAALPTAAPPLRQDAGLIGLIGAAHLISHFSQLLLAPLFPWLKDAFNASYAELGLLMSVFFVVSCASQAAAGFAVDRYGPRPILLAGLSILGTAALGFALSHSYTTLLFFSALAGLGNGVFHPVDFTLLNRKVHASPDVFEYATPVGGTLPVFYDPTYWYEGLRTPIRPGAIDPRCASRP